MDAGQIVNPAKKIVIDDAASGDLLTSRPMNPSPLISPSRLSSLRPRGRTLDP